MKKLLSILIIIVLLAGLVLPDASAVSAGMTFGGVQVPAGSKQVASFKNNFIPATDGWKSLVAYDTPAAMVATCHLKDDVVQVESGLSGSIATADQLIRGVKPNLTPGQIVAGGGYISKGVLDAAAQKHGKEIKNGTIVVDKSTNTVFKVVSPTSYSGIYDADPAMKSKVQALENTYSLERPALNEFVQDFNLEKQTVSLARSNITMFAPNVEKSVVNPSQYKALGNVSTMQNVLVAFNFDNINLGADLGNGLSINVTANGTLAIGDMGLTGKYTANHGYDIEMNMAQELNLDVTLSMELHQEIRIPIYGFNVGFGVGSISGGLFAVLGIDGKITLQVTCDAYTGATQGVEGGTFLYIPTTANPVFKPTVKVDGDCALSGKITGYIKFGVMVNLELFGFDLVGVGVFLGVGVTVMTDGHSLDVTLFGIFNVYVTILDWTLNLIDFKPTIFQRTQADTGGYRVKALETYITPQEGRVGGTLEASDTTDPKNKTGFKAAPDIQYRILVVPAGVTFNPDDPASENKAQIRKYPSGGQWAQTDQYGRYIQKAANMLTFGDKAILEFKPAGQSQPLYSDPSEASLPFKNVTLTGADYFNDYVTGQVDPVHLLNWEAPLDADHKFSYEWVYYAGGKVTVEPEYYNIWDNLGKQSGGITTTLTNDYGDFDTRNITNGHGLTIGGPIQVPPDDPENGRFVYFLVGLDPVDGALNQSANPTILEFCSPKMSLSINETVSPVPGSSKTITLPDGRIMNEMQYDEYIFLVNPNGTRTVTADECKYAIWGFSTADGIYRSDDKAISQAIAGLTGDDKWSTSPIVQPDTSSFKLVPVLDANGKETGSAEISQRVTVQWIWQKHPHPVKITSADNTAVTTAGGTFQVTADGIQPFFAFSLKNAPAGVTIDKSSGLMTLPQNMTAGTYKFTIHAEEDRSWLKTNVHLVTEQGDPYEGNDPSPPDEQTFTLTVSTAPPASPSPSAASSASPSASANPSASAKPSPSASANPSAPAGTKPDISARRDNYQFTMTARQSDLTAPLAATGSTPITWSIVPSPARALPSQIQLDASTGVLSVRRDIAAGTYDFTIKAQNALGSDTQDVRVVVNPPRTAPVISTEKNYDKDKKTFKLTKLVGAAGDLTVPFTASGATPIAWSLEKTNDRTPVPAQVTIDAKTGVLTVKAGIPKGTYTFNVKALNDVGSDTKPVVLDVTSLVLPSLAPPSIQSGLPFETGGLSGLLKLAQAGLKPGNLPPQTVPNIPIVKMQTPLNNVTLTCDHTMDVFTKDRGYTDGSTYIRWDSSFAVTVEGMTYTKWLRDSAPCCDKYHYADPIVIPDSVRQALENEWKQKTAPVSGNPLLGGTIDTSGVLEDIMNPVIWPLENGAVTYFDYSGLMNSLKSKSGGSFDVTLGGSTGTNVSGNLLTGLAGNKGASLSFKQEGVTITFAGADMKTTAATPYAMYNFEFSPKAPDGAAMLKAAGAGGNSFVFSYDYHGQLPGTATFAVKTNIAEGTKVNVYRFDTATGGFTTIAAGVKVGAGGVVTYKNNTMSEYIITTNTIAGAKAASISAQNGALWLWLAAALAAVVIIAAAVILIFRRNRKTPVKK